MKAFTSQAIALFETVTTFHSIVMATLSSAGKTLLDVGIIGCGRIAGGIPGGGDAGLSHASAYAGHEGFRITACVEPDIARRESFMAEWGVSCGYASIEDAINDGQVWDVVSICTPTERHEGDLLSMLETPVRAVWCEKPLTSSAARSGQVVDAFRRSGKQLAVNHLRRWNPSIARLKTQLETGEWGAVRTIAGFYTKGIRNNGSHLIDLIQYFVGPICPLSPVLSHNDHDAADPTVSALLVTEGGLPVHLVGGNAQDYALFELEIVAALGSIRLERSGRIIRIRRPMDDPDTQGYRVLDDGDFSEIGTGDPFLNAADNIYRAVMDGAPLACDGATALAAERVCDALLEQVKPS